MTSPSLIRKSIESICTLIGWGIFISFLTQIPLTFLQWFLDIPIPNVILFIHFKEEILETINTLLIVSYVFIWFMVSWTIYNKHMSTKRNKISRKGQVETDEIQEYFNLETQLLNKMQSDKHIRLDDTIV